MRAGEMSQPLPRKRECTLACTIGQHTLPHRTGQAKHGCQYSWSTNQLQELESAGVSTKGRESLSATVTHARVHLGMHHQATHNALRGRPNQAEVPLGYITHQLQELKSSRVSTRGRDNK
jgi:hypothetical protein